MEQGALRFLKKQDDVSIEVVGKCRDFRAAIRLCIDASGLPVKEVAFALNIQESHFGRMVSADGDRHFPPELIDKLMEVTENEIPLRWLALQRNYGLYRLKTAVEMENEQLRQALEEQRKEKAMLMQLVREIRS